MSKLESDFFFRIRPFKYIYRKKLKKSVSQANYLHNYSSLHFKNLSKPATQFLRRPVIVYFWVGNRLNPDMIELPIQQIQLVTGILLYSRSVLIQILMVIKGKSLVSFFFVTKCSGKMTLISPRLMSFSHVAHDVFVLRPLEKITRTTYVQIQYYT